MPEYSAALRESLGCIAAEDLQVVFAQLDRRSLDKALSLLREPSARTPTPKQCEVIARKWANADAPTLAETATAMSQPVLRRILSAIEGPHNGTAPDADTLLDDAADAVDAAADEYGWNRVRVAVIVLSALADGGELAVGLSGAFAAVLLSDQRLRLQTWPVVDSSEAGRELSDPALRRFKRLERRFESAMTAAERITNALGAGAPPSSEDTAEVIELSSEFDELAAQVQLGGARGDLATIDELRTALLAAKTDADKAPLLPGIEAYADLSGPEELVSALRAAAQAAIVDPDVPYAPTLLDIAHLVRAVDSEEEASIGDLDAAVRNGAEVPGLDLARAALAAARGHFSFGETAAGIGDALDGQPTQVQTPPGDESIADEERPSDPISDGQARKTARPVAIDAPDLATPGDSSQAVPVADDIVEPSQAVAGPSGEPPTPPVTTTTPSATPTVDTGMTPLIEQELFGLAAWDARCAGETDLALAFELFALANAARSGTGSCVAAFRERVSSIGSQSISFSDETRLLLVAAGARMALISPYAGPIDLLGGGRQALGDLPETASLCEAFLDAAQRGVQLPADVGRVRSAGEYKSTIASLRDEAQRALDQGPSRRNKYQAATMVWRSWIRRDGLLGQLLAIVADDDRDRLDEAAAAVVDLRNRSELEQRIHSEDRRVKAKKKITGPARDGLIKWSFDTLDLVSAWHDAASSLEASGSQIEWQDGAIGGLRATAAALRDQVIDELESLVHNGVPESAAAAVAAKRSITDTLNLLLDGQALRGADLNAAVVLNGDLLLAPAILLDERLNPIEEPDPEDLIPVPPDESGPISAWCRAFDQRAEAGDHLGTSLIIERVQQIDAPLAASLADLRAISRESWSQRAAADYKKTEAALSTARRYGYLDDDDWTAFSAALAAADPSDRDDLGLCLTRLSAIRTGIVSARGRAMAAFCTRFAAARQRHPSVEAVADKIEERVSQEDLATADEYLALALEGEALPVAKPTGTLTFESVFPSLIKRLSTTVLDTRLIAAAKAGTRAGEIDFSGVESSDRGRVAAGLEAWDRLCARERQRDYGPLVRPILNVLGLEAGEVAQARRVTSTSDRQWLEIRGVRRNGRALVPDFGSHSSGIAKGTTQLLLLVWDSPSAERLVDVVKQDEDHRPLMVWYFGNRDEAARRDFAVQLRRSHHRLAVVVIDTPLLLALAGSGSQDYESTMRLTLPGSAVNPYLPGVAGLVPQEMFYGRQDELRELQRPHGSSFVYGGRQLGKSALLLAARRKFDNGSNRRAIYLDLKGHRVGVRDGLPPEAVWAVLWTELEAVGVTHGAPPARHVADALTTRIHEWLGVEDDRALLVLLDECDPLLEADAEHNFATVGELKRAMEREERRLKIVFAGLHRVQRYDTVENHPLAHFGEPIAVGPMRPQAAADLVTTPSEALGYRFDPPELVSRILALCNNQPSLIVLFMKALIDRMLGRPLTSGEPPVVITEYDLEQVDQSEDLHGQIKYRFDLTLGLDPAYRVIAYSIALACREEGPEIVVTEPELRRTCGYWWPAGLGGIGADAFRALLKEMVGLGVLAHEGDGYRLRSPNLLGLLGSRDEIEDVLLAAGELPAADAYDPSAHRPPLGHSPTTRSPLSAAQIADLLAPRNQVRVIMGCAASGLDRVVEALEQEAGRREGVRFLTRRASDRAATGAFSLQGETRHTVAVIELGGVDCKRSLDVLDQAKRATSGTRPSTLAVVLVAGPHQLALWRQIIDPAHGVNASVVELRHFDDASLRAMVHDVELPLADDQARASVLSVTGGWWSLVIRALEALAAEGSPEMAVERVREELSDGGGCRVCEESGVLGDDSLRHIYGDLCELAPDGGDPRMLAEALADAPEGADGVEVELEVLRILGALVPADAGSLKPEPVLAEHWRMLPVDV